MATAARSARSESLPRATGAPKTAITASPMCLSIVPPSPTMTASTCWKKRVSNRWTSSGSSSLESRV